ncbi:MAG: helix-turn-helix domain-containing protein [Planctomycetes bacterium]|nr:helix-turn-helix domain-containing protein [Planctomycetota bacterium]
MPHAATRKTPASSLPHRLRAFRESSGLSQKELADRLGISKITLLRWENGSAKPSQLAAQKLVALGFEEIAAEDTNIGEIPRIRRASQGSLFGPEVDVAADRVLRSGVRSEIALRARRHLFEPSPYVYNGPENQLGFFDTLFQLQESQNRRDPLSPQERAERLSCVASVSDLCTSTAQSRLEQPKVSAAHWNPNYGSHGWHRYIGRFPPHLVRALLNHFGATATTPVLDPFAGSGTTLVECRLLGIPCTGVELCPLSAMLSRVKSQFPIDTTGIRSASTELSRWYKERWESLVGHTRGPLDHSRVIERDGNILPPFTNYNKWLTAEAALGISLTLEFAKRHRGYLREAILIALSSKMRSIGNVDVDVARAEYRETPRENVDVLKHVVGAMTKMADAISQSAETHSRMIGSAQSVSLVQSDVLRADLAPSSFDFIITSPPYGVESSSYLRSHLLSYRCLEPFLGVDPYDFGKHAIGSEYVHDGKPLSPDTTAWRTSPTLRKFFAPLIAGNAPRAILQRCEMMVQFFNDMSTLGSKFRAWLRPRGRVAFVIGNKRVGTDVIPTDAIVAELFEALGFTLERSIQHKLKCNNSNAQVPWQERVIQDEFVMLFRRDGGA